MITSSIIIANSYCKLMICQGMWCVFYLILLRLIFTKPYEVCSGIAPVQLKKQISRELWVLAAGLLAFSMALEPQLSHNGRAPGVVTSQGPWLPI